VATDGSNDSPTQRLKAAFLGRLKRFEERRFARQVCSESLATLHALQTQQPTLKGAELYKAVIARRLQLDAAGAHALMWRIRASNEEWETEHEPKFIDVVKYLIVSEYLGQDATADGMRLDLGEFLSQRIDPNL
jgi:hypothetical protein